MFPNVRIILFAVVTFIVLAIPAAASAVAPGGNGDIVVISREQVSGSAVESFHLVNSVSGAKKLSTGLGNLTFFDGRAEFSPDGRELLVKVNNNWVGYFDAANGTLRHYLGFPHMRSSNVAYLVGPKHEGRIAWVRSSGGAQDLVTSNLSGGQIKQIYLSANDTMGGVYGQNEFLASPTSDKLYVTVGEPHGGCGAGCAGGGGPETGYGVYEFDMNTKAKRKLFVPRNATNTISPEMSDVSPDGRFILWRAGGGSNYSYQLYDIKLNKESQLYPSGTGTAKNLLPPKFSPDGTMVVFAEGPESNQRTLRRAEFKVDPEGNTVPSLTNVQSFAPSVKGDLKGIAWQPSGNAPFDWKQTPGSVPGAIDFNTQVDKKMQPATFKWDFADGSEEATGEWAKHVYKKPGEYAVKHSFVKQSDPSVKGQSVRIVDVPAPKLVVSLIWDEEVEIEGRLPVGETIDATLRVRASSDGLGSIKNIKFDKNELLRYSDDKVVEVKVVDENDDWDKPFELERGKARDIAVTIKTKAPGRVTFHNEVKGKDEASPSRDVIGKLSKPIRVGFDFQVDFKAEVEKIGGGSYIAFPAQGIELEVDEETGEPKPRNFKLRAEVTNISGVEAEEVEFDLQAVLEAARPGGPLYTKHGVSMKRYRVLTSEKSEWVELGDDQRQKVLAIRIGAGSKSTLANKGKAVIEFEGEAIRESVQSMRAMVNGVDRTDPKKPAKRSGHGRIKLRVDQDVVLVAEPTGDGFDTSMIRAGDIWSADVRIINVSESTTAKVRVLAERSGNIIGATIGELGGVQMQAPGVVVELKPGERFIVQGSFTSNPDAGTRAMLKLAIDGWIIEDADKVYEKIEDQPVLEQEKIVIKDDNGSPANEYIKPIDTRNPMPVPFATWGEGAWVFTDSFMRGIGKWTEQSIAAGRTITQAVLKADVYAMQAYTVMYAHLDPEVRQKTRDEVAAIYQRLANVTFEEAMAKVNKAVEASFIPTMDAYYASDHRKLTEHAGNLLGEELASKAVETVLPQLLATRYMKYGGKTAILKAQNAQDSTFLGRIQRNGRGGFEPGDRVSFTHAVQHWGIDRLTDSRLLDYAQKKGIIIAVRDRSPGSVARLKKGALPKIEKIKAKNVNDIDVEYLGFDPSHKDLAMIKQMPSEASFKAKLSSIGDPEIRAKVEARFWQRKQEFNDHYREMMDYDKAGKIPVPSKEYGLNPNSNTGGGIEFDDVWDSRDFRLARAGTGGVAPTRDGFPAFQPQMQSKPGGSKFEPFTGDMDPIAFLDESGQVLSLERRMEVYRELAERGIQHPESLTWDNAAGRASYLNGFDMANEKSESLLAYLPNGTRRAVMFDSRKSHWDVDENALKKVMMYFDGIDRVGKAKEVYEGIVKWSKVIMPDEKAYFGPGDKSDFVDKDDLPQLRLNENGEYEHWTPGVGWTPYVPTSGQMSPIENQHGKPSGRSSRSVLNSETFAAKKKAKKIQMLPQSALRFDAEAGSTELMILGKDKLGVPSSAAWFRVGSKIVINPGAKTQETHKVAAINPLTLTKPLKHAHAPGEQIGIVPRLKPAVIPNVGVSTTDRSRRALVANLACPTGSGKCSFTFPKTIKHKIGGRSYTARVSGSKSLRAGKRGTIRVQLAPSAAMQLNKRSSKIAIQVKVRNKIGKRTDKLSVTVAKPKASVVELKAAAKMSKSGKVTIGKIACPAGAGSCMPRIAKTVTMRINGKKVKAKVSAPKSIRAGKSTKVTLTIPKASRKRVPVSQYLAVPVNLKLTAINEGGSSKLALRAEIRR